MRTGSRRPTSRCSAPTAPTRRPDLATRETDDVSRLLGLARLGAGRPQASDHLRRLDRRRRDRCNPPRRKRSRRGSPMRRSVSARATRSSSTSPITASGTTRTSTNNTISLWGETLSVTELREMVASLDPGVRVVMLMSQCFSGSFAHVIHPGRTRRPVRQRLRLLLDHRRPPCLRLLSRRTAAADGIGHSHHFLEAVAGLDRFGTPPRRASSSPTGRPTSRTRPSTSTWPRVSPRPPKRATRRRPVRRRPIRRRPTPRTITRRAGRPRRR